MKEKPVRIKPHWMHDCKWIDELENGEIAYCMDGAFVPKNKMGGWVIYRDDLCSSIQRGTHDTMMIRIGDEIYVREGVMGSKVTADRYESIKDHCFPAYWKPLTLEEKVAILWNERRR